MFHLVRALTEPKPGKDAKREIRSSKSALLGYGGALNFRIRAFKSSMSSREETFLKSGGRFATCCKSLPENVVDGLLEAVRDKGTSV